MRQRDIDKLNRESEQLWLSQFEQVPAKIGTVPMNVWIDKEIAKGVMDGTLTTGDCVHWREGENGQKMTGVIRQIRIDTEGVLTLFEADRM